MSIRRRKAKTGRRRTCKELNPWAKLPQLYVDYFDEHLESCRTEFDELMCYYKHYKLDELGDHYRSKLWKLTDKFITFCEKGHFKKTFQDRDVHIDRILAYYEWQRLMSHKSPKECRFIFQKAFADFLAVLQCRKLGIALPHNNCLLNIRTKLVKYWKAYFICKRENLTIEEYYVYKQRHLYMYDDVWVEYQLFFSKIEMALSACESPIYVGCHELPTKTYEDTEQEDTLLSEL